MIKIRNITKTYEEIEIFKDVNYTFPQRGLVCLLGPSGCGKSTLLNLIAGFDTDYSGSITVGENILSSLNINELCNYRKDHVGFIFQDYHLITGYTVLENVLLPCDLLDNDYEENVKKATILLEKLGIESKANEKVENLSGGQKQRVSIARALIKDPTILLADEPIGSLDRKTSNEIMEVLKSIAKDILVVVITHDNKVCSFAQEIINIENKSIIGVENKINTEDRDRTRAENKTIRSKEVKVDAKKIAKKNFKVHMKQFITIAIIVALSISAFMLSISSQNMMESYINKFKEKNTGFNNGYIKYDDKNMDQDVLKLLEQDSRVIDAYYQYKIENISLSIDKREEILPELVPMPKTEESLSYGVMPRNNKNEIAITPSLAKKLNNDISKLVGKTINLKVGTYSTNLKVSGIYNAGYDSIFISSNIEKEIYKNIEHTQEIVSIVYDVKTFENVIDINDMLLEYNINSINSKEEVNNLINTFESINKLFLVVSILIFLVGLFISIVLLSKLQNSRFREIGLFSALGFNTKQIKDIILTENIILSILSSIIILLLIGTFHILSKTLNIPIEFNITQLLFSVIITFFIVIMISIGVSDKLVKTEASKALRM